jgi:hypothetical protein
VLYREINGVGILEYFQTYNFYAGLDIIFSVIIFYIIFSPEKKERTGVVVVR